jgi:nitric oxide reductase NorD protein
MFEWEESTFLGFKSLYQRFVTKPRQREREARRVNLSDHRSAFVLLARMLSGQDLGVFETENPILYTRDRICLPPHFDEAATPGANLELYELKTILAALAHRDQWQGNCGGLEAYAAELAHEFPRLPDKISAVEHHLLPDPDEEITLWQILGASGGGVGADREVTTPVPVEPAGSQEDVTTEIEGKGQMHVEVLPDTGDDGHGADMPIHTFEKTECLEETSGLSRKKDSDDELEDHEEALREVEMKEVIRSPERPRSIYRSDIILDGFSLEIDDEGPAKGIPYPEWDYRRREYRNDWCCLQQTRNRKQDPEWCAAIERKHASLITSLKRQFAAITSDFLKLKRQPTGDDFDLDAIVDAQVLLRAGHAPGEAIYLNRKKDIHDVSAILLQDLSFSTDAWIDDARVLDSIMETVYCLGEVIENGIESFAVAGFSSNTRRSCRFEIIKDFDEPWARAKPRFGSLQSEGYTRIGPALRHAQELLLNQQSSRKVIILVTDGRPCDYDRYEGTYGIRDVRKAIETGKIHGLQTHAFAIEKQATETFPMMFSRDHFDVVQSPVHLTRRMSKLFARLVAS